MQNNKNFDSHDDDKEEFQSFLDLLKGGIPFGEDSEINDEEDDEYPNLNEHFGTDEFDDDVCPVISAIPDIIEKKIDSIGFLGLNWSDEEMIEILEKMNYEKSVFTLELDFPEDTSDNPEAEVMKLVLPDGKLDINVMKKPGEEITNDNFDNHRPKNLFQSEMKKMVKEIILDKLSGNGN